MKKTKILMLDDDADLGRSLKRYFDLRRGWEFTAVCHVQAARERLALFQPDLLILDCNLGTGPEDGFEFLKRLRGRARGRPAAGMAGLRELPVLILTGKSRRPKDVASGFDLGADQYLVKPISPRELEMRVVMLLRWLRQSAAVAPEGPP